MARFDVVTRFRLLLWFGLLFFGVFFSSVEAFDRLPDYREVYADAQTLIRELRNDPGAVYLNLARVGMEKGLWVDSRHYAHRALAVNPSSFEAEAIAAVASAFLGDARADENMQFLRNRQGSDILVGLLEAIASDQAGKPDKARKVVNALLERDSGNLASRYFSGRLYLAAQDNDNAEKEFKRILNREPTYVPALGGMGQIFLLQNERRMAIRFFERALENDPENLSFHQQLLNIYRHYGDAEGAQKTLQIMNFYTGNFKQTLLGKGRQLFKQGDFPQVVEEMEWFFSHFRKSPEASFLLAAALINLGKSKEAIQDLGAYLLEKWGSPQAHYSAGICFLAMEDVDGAAEQFKEAVSRSPALNEGFLALLVIEQMRGNYEKALEGFGLARERGVLPPLVQYLMAQTYLAQGNWSKYGERMSQATGLIPGFPGNMIFTAPQKDLWRSVARDRSLFFLYFRSSWYGKALEAADRLVRVCPEDIFIQYFRALSLEMKGQTRQAKESFVQLVRTHSNLAEGYLGIGRLAMKAGDLDEAEVAFRKSLELYPEYAQGHMLLGDLLVRRGKFEMAEKNFRRASTLAPFDSRAYARLSRLLAEDSETLLEAAALARRAYELDPTDPLAMDATGWTLVLEGDSDEGLEKIAAARLERRDDPIILYHYGYALFLQGNLPDARQSLDQALTLAGNFPGADRAREILGKIPVQEK